MTTSLIACGYADAAEPGVRAYTFDSATNILTPRGSFTGIANPSFVVVHPRQPWLVVTSETAGPKQPGAVWTLRFSADPWTFDAISTQESGGDGPCHLRLHSSGAWVVVSNYSSGSVAVLPIDDDGQLGAITSHHQHSGSSVNTSRQEGPHAHSSIFSPDERFLIVADLGTDQLVVYAFDAQHGTLTPHGAASTQPGAGPRHMVFSADGSLLYAANELDNTVTTFAYDAATGTLTERGAVSTLPADAPLSYVADIHLTASGTHLLVSNRGHNSIAVFELAADGTPTLVATPSCGGDWPRNFAVTADDSAVLVANQNSGTLAVLPLSSGSIAASASDVAHPGVACIAWIPGE